MIDTIARSTFRPLKKSVVAGLKTNRILHWNGWKLMYVPDDTVTGDVTLRLKAFGPRGIVCLGHDRLIEWEQGSRPGLLFDNNGRLIRSAQALAEAETKHNALLDEISEPPSSPPAITRLDLVLQFRVNVERFLNAHRHIRHPFIRNETAEYKDRGIVLPGQKCQLKLYDKRFEMGLGRGDVLRVEFQLRKPVLGKAFGLRARQPLTHIDFDKSYKVYRRLMLMIKDAPVPKKMTFNSLMAECEAGGFVCSNGLTPMENYRGSYRHDTFLARRRRVNKFTLSAACIDWAELLPEGFPDGLPDILLARDGSAERPAIPLSQ